MSLSRPLRIAFSKSRAPARTLPRQEFHSSLHLRQNSKHTGLEPSKERGLTKKVTVDHVKPYTDSEKKLLAERYTPDQLVAIEAGEAAVDPNDLVTQGAIRIDPFALPYIDDLSIIRPVVDKPIRAPESNYDPNQRFKDEDEIAEDIANWAQSLPEIDPNSKSAEEDAALEWRKFFDKQRLTVGKPEAELNPRSSLAPAIPKLADYKRIYGAAATSGAEEVDVPTRRLMLQTGYTAREIRQFRTKILLEHRVVNQTRMGKISSVYFLAVAGNQKGLLGIGEGKAAEPEDARRQATMAAIRTLQPIPRYEYRTIYGDVKGKVGATELELMTRPPGFGIRCQASIYEMCKCAGISDLAARVTRARNPMNTVKATLQALLSQRLPEDVARGRGKKLVDVRKVYYGGNL
ncbi:28S ribosomal protein S5, mitochondrial [Toensbergia leucococca]|nr:28S ribosomal protein S5, mitochondrial [Toensbergia leucococca]